MVTLTINDTEVKVEPGTTIINAAVQAGIFIPYYCWHPALSIVGSCRLCLVEIEGAPKEIIACGTPVSEGMVVKTKSDKVKHAQEIVLEFLLLNHPLDCPVCDKAGECHLQDYSFEYGKSHSRFEEPKRVPPFKDLGQHVKLATTRCILCTRCTRFMDEIGGDAQLTVINRGYNSEIATARGKQLDHPLAGNVVDICPVGALLDKNFIHRTRVWQLNRTSSVCGECSAGCNISVDSYNDTIYRIIPRTNMEVNKYWICDTGRYSQKKYGDLERLTIPRTKKNGVLAKVDWNEALREVSAGFKKHQKTSGAVAALISPGTLNEDVFAVKEYLKTAVNSSKVSGMFFNPGKNDTEFRGGFTIKGDDSPNQEGLRYILEMDEPDIDGASIVSGIQSGKIKALYVVHNDLGEVSPRILSALPDVPFLIVEDITMSPLAQIADVVLPGMTYYEKTGTFMNYKKRLQVVQKSVEEPDGARNTWEIVKMLASGQKHPLKWNSSAEIFMLMAKRYPGLEGFTHFKIGSNGVKVSVNNKAVIHTNS